jgi:hypothetical protein
MIVVMERRQQVVSKWVVSVAECGCGCGQKLVKSYDRQFASRPPQFFIRGHNRKGTTFHLSKTARKKISQAHKRYWRLKRLGTQP